VHVLIQLAINDNLFQDDIQNHGNTFQAAKPLRPVTTVLKKGLRAGLPDFSWYNWPTGGKCTKLPQNIPNGHKRYKMAVK
jgi:hypothetical protein